MKRANAVVKQSSYEARSVAVLARANPDALLEVASTCLWRVGDAGLDPSLRIRLADIARHASLHAVQAAPSDYEGWLWLGRSENVLGRNRAAQLCLDRGGDLAPARVNLNVPR
jgi:cytochrome c-type biogenesis protein CcmH/NrfG